jgi:tRNA A37 methylthiotransferase MiaB
MAAGKKRQFLQQQTGKELLVLVQVHDSKTETCRGLARNYVNVRFPGAAEQINTECRVRITGVTGQEAIGVLVA